MCSPSIPDTSAATEAAAAMNTQVANRQLDMQQQAYDYFKNRQDTLVDPLATQVTQAQLDIAKQNADQGADLYNYNKQVFRPVEESLVSQAMRDSTPQYYEQYAQQAMTTAANANANAQAQTDRMLQGMGVNPASGAYAATQRGLQIRNAAAIAGAGNDAYDKAQAQSWNERAAAAGLGRGLVTQGTNAFSAATGANAGATSATNGANAQAAGTLGTATQYAGLGVQATKNASDAYNDIYRTQANASSQDSGLMGALGTAVGGWGSSGFTMPKSF